MNMPCTAEGSMSRFRFGRHTPATESLPNLHNAHESNNLAAKIPGSIDQVFVGDKGPMDFDNVNTSKLKDEFKGEFVKLCRSPVIRNRTKGLINQYHRHLGNQIEIDDILAEVYIRALRAIESGRTIQNLSAWVRTTSMNVLRELYRAADREHKLERIAEQEFSIESFALSESCDLEDSVVTGLWARFERLSPAEQKILMWEAGGKSYKLISELLVKECSETNSLSENAIAQRIRRARKKLRSIIPEKSP
jgi:RNA polymerase sigma factor (sigma-70 family)